MNQNVEEISFVAIRERLPGQSKSNKLFPVRCSNPECSVNKNTGVNTGGKKLLGNYRAGTYGEVQCSRCGAINKIDVKEDIDESIETPQV